MFLHSSGSLATAPNFSPAELESLTRSVEQKKQRLENDISNYIRCKQEELCNYERELIERFRSTEGPATTANSNNTVDQNHSPSKLTRTLPTGIERISSDSATDSQDNETTRRTKHNRVHKREKELCGLVTPLYLPLLEANNIPQPAVKRKEKRKHRDMNKIENDLPNLEHQSSSDSVDKVTERRRSRSGSVLNESRHEQHGDRIRKEIKDDKQEAGKASRRPALRKSSLRGSDSPRVRRKRVSIVIDDQIVLPADNIVESAIESPMESSADITPDEMRPSVEVIDPALIDVDTPPVHQEPVHHSLPYPIQSPVASPSKETDPQMITASASTVPVANDPPQTATRTYLDPSPPGSKRDIPRNASGAPIYANRFEVVEREDEERIVGDDVDSHDFDTYVGGLSGSGVDNVNQTGSYGYPSSLGASYMDSYMKSRPLSVRLAAAERAGLEGKEREQLIQGGRTHHDNRHDNRGIEDDEVDVRQSKAHDDEDEEMDVIGSMEGF